MASASDPSFRARGSPSEPCPRRPASRFTARTMRTRSFNAQLVSSCAGCFLPAAVALVLKVSKGACWLSLNVAVEGQRVGHRVRLPFTGVADPPPETTSLSTGETARPAKADICIGNTSRPITHATFDGLQLSRRYEAANRLMLPSSIKRQRCSMVPCHVTRNRSRLFARHNSAATRLCPPAACSVLSRPPAAERSPADPPARRRKRTVLAPKAALCRPRS